MIKSWTNTIFKTKDAYGKRNGHIIRVWEQDRELDGYRPKQVYVTTLLPGAAKGPHLHQRRDSLFCCIQGYVDIIVREGIAGAYHYHGGSSGGPFGPVAIHVPAGCAAVIRNREQSEALVLNLSSGGYDPSDETEVKDFGYGY